VLRRAVAFPFRRPTTFAPRILLSRTFRRTTAPPRASNSTSVSGIRPKRWRMPIGIVTWPLDVIFMANLELESYHSYSYSPHPHSRGRVSACENRPVAKAGDDLDAQLDALYATPLAEFTAARNALAKSLDAAGWKDDAARVKALKKPSASAWAVNALAVAEPKLLSALVASGERLRAKPADVREAMRERRKAVTAAAKAAERALTGAGHAANADTQRRISATLEAIATLGKTPGGPVAGRLTEDVPAPGFDEIAALGLLGAAVSRGKAAVPSPPPAAPKPAPKASAPSKQDLAREKALEEKKRREAEKRIAEAKRDADRARAALADAGKAVAAQRRKKTSLDAAFAEAAAEEERLAAAEAEAREALAAAEAALREALRPVASRP
jgi:hypothetical protein